MNQQKTTRLLVILLTCLCGPVLAGTECNPLTEAKRIIEPFKSTWTAPPRKTPANHSVDGPLLGNGNMAVTFAGPPERQQFYITKNDFWRLKSEYGKSGPRPLAKLDVSIEALQDAEYHLEQAYHEPVAEARFQQGDSSVLIRSWVAATSNVLVVELSATGKAFDVAVSLSSFEGDGSETQKGNSEGLHWITRRFVQDVDIPTEAAVTMTVIGADNTTFQLLPGRPVTVVLTSASRFKHKDYLAETQRQAQRLDDASLSQLRTSHAEWWARYWARSYVDIGDDPVALHYYRSLYVMGACSRNPAFPPSIFGSWITTDRPAWAGDYHLNYNHMAPYYGLYSANRIEQADPQDAPLLDFVPRGHWYAEHVTKTRGVLYPVGIGPLGIETTRNADPYRNSPNFENGGLFFQQRSNAAYCLVNIAQRWRCTYDPAYGRRVYPFVRDIVEFWEDYLKFEEGRYVIYGDAIHEGSGQNKNPILTLGLLHNAFALALDMSETLETDADRRTKWRHILDHLSNFATQERDGKTVFRYTEEGTDWWRDNTLGIQHIYPAGAIGLDSDPKLLEVAHSTIDVMKRWIDFNGSNSFFPAAVRIGYDPNVILQKLGEYSQNTYPNGFQKDNPHGIENCSTVPNTINEMLCMGHGDVLRVFAVWPKNRNARFHNIRTWGAFRVSGVLTDGDVEYVRLSSEKGRPCTLVNPWPGRKVQLQRNGEAAEQLAGDRITFQTSVDEEILLREARPVQIVAGPYLQNPSETSMTMMWITDQSSTSWVEYGQGESLDQKAHHGQHGLIDADQTIHKIEITGLSPGKPYRYRVCSKEILKFEAYKVTYGATTTSDTHTFTTLDRQKNNMSFIVLNDIHERNEILTSLAKIAQPRTHDLVFLNGDILGHIENQQQIIDHVLTPCTELFASETPFVYIRGNHETRGRFARMLPDYIASPQNRYYYAFDHGPVHFIVLDGGEDKEDSHWAYSGLVDFDRYRDEQKQWLEQEIRSDAFTKAPYRVVLVHMPPNPSENWHGPMDMYNKWRPVLNEGRIDLMICGHTHRYAVVAPQAGVHDYPMVIGGGPKAGRAVVIHVDAARDKLQVTMTRDDSQVVGAYTIQRN